MMGGKFLLVNNLIGLILVRYNDVVWVSRVEIEKIKCSGEVKIEKLGL